MYVYVMYEYMYVCIYILCIYVYQYMHICVSALKYLRDTLVKKRSVMKDCTKLESRVKVK